MKKIILLAAFAGLLTSAAVANTKGDDKDKKAKKECCQKGENGKACAGEKKESCKKGEEKACCKKGAEHHKGESKAADKK